jgi:hypothetical protein
MHPNGIYQGTSFATPRLSLWAARYLLGGGDSPCADSPNIHPVLGYMPEIGDWLTINAEAVNLPLEEAIATYCPRAEN